MSRMEVRNQHPAVVEHEGVGGVTQRSYLFISSNKHQHLDSTPAPLNKKTQASYKHLLVYLLGM